MRDRLLVCLALLVPAFACADRDLIQSLDPELGDQRPFVSGEQYAACERGDDCLDEWCLSPANEAGFCTQACDPSDDVSIYCEAATEGTATTVCLQVGGDAACALDCGGERHCPAGMRCEQVEAQGLERSICF